MIIKHIIRGAGYIEGYGHHPGNTYFLSFILLGGIVGFLMAESSRLIGGASLAFVEIVAILPFYVMGCIDRSKNYERDKERLINILRDS